MKYKTFLLLLLLVVAAEPASAADPRATLTLNQIVNGLAETSKRYDPTRHSYLFRYREDTTYFDLSGAAVPEHGRWVDSTFARKGKSLYSNLKSKLAKNAAVDEEIVAWCDGICTQRKRDGVNVLPYLVAQARSYTAFTEGCGIDVYRGLEWTSPTEGSEHPYARSLAEEHFWLFPQMVSENRKWYRVRPDLERVDADWCHVVEWPGHDIIWLDVRRGFLPRKRTLLLKEGVPIVEWLTDQPSQVRPGVWLPSKVKTTRYYNPSEKGEKHAGKVKYTDDIRLLEFRYDDLTDDFFQVPMKPDEKLLISDSIRKMTYMRHPDGADPVAMALADAEAGRPRPSRRVWLLGNAVALATVSALLMGRRIWRTA